MGFGDGASFQQQVDFLIRLKVAADMLYLNHNLREGVSESYVHLEIDENSAPLLSLAVDYCVSNLANIFVDANHTMAFISSLISVHINHVGRETDSARDFVKAVGKLAEYIERTLNGGIQEDEETSS